ncbi:unnamed protein product [Lepidochelys olivacea]
MQAELMHWDPEVIFAGQWCLVYAQLRGQPQVSVLAWLHWSQGRSTLQMFISCRRSTVCMGGYTPRHSHGGHHPAVPHPEPDLEGDAAVLPAATGWRQRLPVHRLAAKSLLLELEGAVSTGSEGDRRRALEASLSSGVVCSLMAYMERGQLVQGLLVRGMSRWQMIDCVSRDPICEWPASGVRLDEPNQRSVFGRLSRDLAAAQRAPEESPLLRLVSLQNADVWWNLDPRLAAVLGVSGTNARGRIPSEDVTPSIWATVLAMVWLHGQAVGQPDESSCWRPRLWAGCGTEQVQTRAGQTFSS